MIVLGNMGTFCVYKHLTKINATKLVIRRDTKYDFPVGTCGGSTGYYNNYAEFT